MHSLPLNDADLTECQRRFYESLRPGQMMESLFNAIPGAFYFVKDSESRFMSASLSFAKTMGETSVQALIGKTDYDYSPDFLADIFFGDDQAVMRTGQPMYDKIELVPSADGSLDWLCTSKVPLFDECGAVVGLAGITRVIRGSDAVFSEHPEMRVIIDYVRQHYRVKIVVADLANVAGISVSSQERLFKKTFGLTPVMYIRRTRLNAACRLLRESKLSLSDIAIQCGFNDQTNMTRAFRLELNITPLKYRRNFSQASPPRHGRQGTVLLRSQF
jgi:AraC-like DNA-binding protein